MKEKKHTTGGKPVTAVELAILNGIEAYNREQEKKRGKRVDNTRTAEAYVEAGLKPRRRSHAKGKGTKLVLDPAPKKPVQEKGAPRGKKGGNQGGKNVQPRGGNPPKNKKNVPPQAASAPVTTEKTKKKKPVKVLFFGGVGEIGKNMTAIEYGNDIIVIDAGIIFPTEEIKARLFPFSYPGRPVLKCGARRLTAFPQ